MGKNIATKYDIGVLNQNSIVVDGGGYKGEWCKYILDTFKCKVYIFEPHPDNLSKIHALVGRNENAVLVQCALFGEDGTRKLRMTPNADGYSLYDRSKKNWKALNEMNVRTLTVATFLNEFDVPYIDLMKLNVEGSEIDILMSLDKRTASKVKRISFAAHGGKIVEPSAVKTAIRHARSVGYEVFNYVPRDWAKKGKFNRWTCIFRGDDSENSSTSL